VGCMPIGYVYMGVYIFWTLTIEHVDSKLEQQEIDRHLATAMANFVEAAFN